MSVLVNRSTIDHNTASDPADVSADGGGIETYNATLTLANSTVSGNTVTAATYSSGGGIWMGGYADAYPSVLNLVNSTITGNSATGGGGGISNYLDAANASATVNAVNTIVAGNAAPAGGNCLAEGAPLPRPVTTSKTPIPANSISPPTSPTPIPYWTPGQQRWPDRNARPAHGQPGHRRSQQRRRAAAPVSGVDQRGVSRPQGPCATWGRLSSRECRRR
ncbi:MAG: hypothetical protein HZY76_10410 [Anaerolineae bacterium]|nr:MAG: hypothetical protein HZY76_10410 [Anaerolineae bacterium]